MALVGEIVARFKAESSDYLKKTAELKAKNREVAADLIKTAGSAEKAMATLTVARRSGDDLSAFGIDKRNVSGVIGQIKELAKGGTAAAKSMKEAGNQANALGDATGDAFDAFARGDYLKGFEKFKKGMADLQEGSLSTSLKVALTATALHKVGEITAAATAKAVDLKQQWIDGKITAGQMTEQLLAQVPIYGGIWQTGRNIRELLGFENHELEKQNELLQAVNDERQKTLDIAKEIRANGEAEKQKVGDLNDQVAIEKLKSQGNDAKASALGIQQKLKRDLRAAEQEINTWAEAEKQKLDATSGKDGKSLDQMLKEAADKARQALDTFYGHSTEKTRDDYTAASVTLGSVQAAVNQREAQKRQIAEDAKAQIEARRKAIKDVSEAEYDATFTKPDAAGNRRLFTPAELDGADSLKGLRSMIEATLSSIQIKAQPITDWMKQQVDAATKELDRLRGVAGRLAESVKSPVAKLGEELQDAIKASKADPTAFGPDALAKYFGNTRDGLLAEKANLEGSLGKSVYSLPDIKELRGGQTLYAPPSSDTKEMIKRLQEINDKLATLNKTAADGGINIEVIGK